MAKAKQKKQTYYEVENNPWNSGVTAGRSISVQRTFTIMARRLTLGHFLLSR